MNRWLAIAFSVLLLWSLLARAQQHAGDAAPVAMAPQAGVGAAALEPIHEKAAIILLHGEVDDIMLHSLERRLDLARKAGCSLVIYQLDTYGGLLTSCLDMTRLTRRLAGEKMSCVAWVNDKAISAGAIIACSCGQIVMTHNSVLGDCAPIELDVTGAMKVMPVAERAKKQSPVLEDLDDSAAQNHYDAKVLHAMVVPEIEIDEVHNSVTGETRYVDSDTKTVLLAQETPKPDGTQERPWKFVDVTDGPTQLLTVSAELAHKMGLSKGTIDTEQELRAALNIRGELLVLDFSWAELATMWLTQGYVRLALFIGMLVFAWIEFSHPGVTVPGVVAAVCLLLLVGAPFLTGLAQVWEIVCIVVGVGIIVADLSFFGGIGFLAVPGFILMAVGLVASFVPVEPGGGWLPTMPATWAALQTGLAVLVFGSILSLVAFFLLSKFLYITPGFNKLQLHPAGTAAPLGAESRQGESTSAADTLFVGAIGIAATDLRPAGKVRFDNTLVDVVSYGSFIPENTEVEIISLSMHRITVRPRPSAPASTSESVA